MQFFSADVTIFLEKKTHFFANESMKKPASKVALNRPPINYDQAGLKSVKGLLR